MGYNNPVTGPMSNTGINVGQGRSEEGTSFASQTDSNLGAAAASQQAYQPQFSNAGSNAQSSALGYLNTAASGLGPSSAQLMGQQAINQSLSAQLAGAASARGGSLGQAAAIRNAQLGAGAFQANAIQGLAANRAQEMAQAQMAYANASSAQRGQDLQQSGMMSQNEFQQRQLNQQGQLGFQGLAQQSDANQAQTDLGVAGLNSQNWQSWQSQDQSNAGAAQRQDQQIQWEKEQQAAKMAEAGIGAAASMGSTLGAAAMAPTPPIPSDPRVKWDVVPLMDSPDGRQLHQTPQGQAYFADAPQMQTRDGRPSLEVVEMAPQQRQSPTLGQAAHARAKAAPEARRQMTDADLMRAADAIGQQQRSDFDARMAQGPAVMADANRALAPSAYRYQDAYTPPGQAPGEVNVGPMADRMAQSPLSATAVKRAPDGMMMIDHGKGLRLALGGVGSLQQQVDELRQQQGGR